MNGVACVVDPTVHAGGQQHLSPKRGSFFGGVEVPVPAAAVTRGPRPGLDAIVKVWSGAVTATDNIVVSTVALLVETSNATGVVTPTQTSVTTTTPTPTTTRILLLLRYTTTITRQRRATTTKGRRRVSLPSLQVQRHKQVKKMQKRPWLYRLPLWNLQIQLF